ncbi:MAG: ketoacyl-ACP synthase III [Neisseria sp.]|nr:ketoacyl-ACP synthase III [Neisseria sp.]MDO5687273.1 ketoacyl-ACP synthase III [Neisseria sp.]
MAFQTVKNVKIAGVSGCVPKKVEENKGHKVFDSVIDSEKFIATTGVERRHIANDDTTTSDMCFHAAEKLLAELNWSKDSVDCLVFVTQTPDYILPATSCILQDRLKLSEECYTLDISLGCSGWVYGLSTISTLLSSGDMKRGLLLCGETTLKPVSKTDKSAYPLFGDAGTATAIEFSENNTINFHLATDGSGFEAIIIPDGGYRNPFTADSLSHEEIEPGISRNKLQTILNGMDVFSFGISKAPQTVNKLLGYIGREIQDIDYAVFHQANLFMNEKIRKKLKLDQQQVPYSLKNYGNTSSASIPITMITELREQLQTQRLNNITCGFGVGLSWGSAYFETDRIVVPELVII